MVEAKLKKGPVDVEEMVNNGVYALYENNVGYPVRPGSLVGFEPADSIMDLLP